MFTICNIALTDFYCNDLFNISSIMFTLKTLLSIIILGGWGLASLNINDEEIFISTINVYINDSAYFVSASRAG